MSVTWLETRPVPVDQLTRFPGNARRGDVGAIRESIRKTGQYRAIVVRKTDDGMVILAGNHTFEAIGAEGGDSVRCEIIQCTDAEALRINLADNRLTELGDYDGGDLAALLAGLDGDLDGTGFTEEDLSQLLPGTNSFGGSAPEEFTEYDEEIDTKHECPKCGYEWS